MSIKTRAQIFYAKTNGRLGKRIISGRIRKRKGERKKKKKNKKANEEEINKKYNSEEEEEKARQSRLEKINSRHERKVDESIFRKNQKIWRVGKYCQNS